MAWAPTSANLRTISLCLRVRLRLLTAGLLLLRAAGGTAEEAAAAAAAAKEGGETMGSTGGSTYNTNNGKPSPPSSAMSSGTGHTASLTGNATQEELEETAKLSQHARLKLLRRACSTLAELDALEESLVRKRGGTNGTHKRGPGVSLNLEGMLEGEADRTLRANLAGTCVSIMEEMTVPRDYKAADMAVSGGGQGRKHERDVGGMAHEVERVVREEKVRDRND